MFGALLVSAFAWSTVAAISGSRHSKKSALGETWKQNLGSTNDDAPLLLHRQSDNAKGSAFAVDGNTIPDVDFDLGESYAGLLPVSQEENETAKLWFWYFPSTSSDVGDEITIWLNGGPGCSSLEGLLQENGPLSWKPGTYRPVKNRWSWHHLTNMVWVDQPVGTGFSQGALRDTSEDDVAEHFMGWLRNFVDTFGLHSSNIYLTGESYAAGMYIPYIAYAMYRANDTTYYNLQGTLGYSPALVWASVSQLIPSVPFIDHWAGVFNLNSSFVASMHNASDSCGHTKWMDEHLTFPPPEGSFGTPPDGNEYRVGCDTWSAIFDAANLANPCFNSYHITDQCPPLWDVLGYPTSFAYTPPGADIYFNRSDVQTAINAPATDWTLCNNDVLSPDTSEWSSFADAGETPVLPRVIEQNKRTVLVGGQLDFNVLLNGTLLAIQNMTWTGAQGFREKPSDPFLVPYFDQEICNSETLDSAIEVSCGDANFAGSGIMGTTHTERGLTWVEMASTGHMGPQHQPAAAYRHLEFLLGRIDSLTTS